MAGLHFFSSWSSPSQTISVVVCACILGTLAVPQLGGFTWQGVQTHVPCHEDDGKSERVVGAVPIGRSVDDRSVQANRRVEMNRPRPNCAHRNGALAIIGHSLANGLRAPLVV